MTSGFRAALREILPAVRPPHNEGSTAVVDQAQLRGDAAIVAKAVAALPNDGSFDTRESYLHVGYAIKAALGDGPEAFDLWWSWCARWSGGVNDPEVVNSDWRRMKPPFKIGASWIYEKAEKLSNGAFSRAELWFEEPKSFENLFPPEPSDTAAIRQFTFLNAEELAAVGLNSADIALVADLLDQGALSVVYGPSNVGKSFLALLLAFHIALGLDLIGKAVAKNGCAYVVAEGGRGFGKRVAAHLKHFGPAPGFRGLPAPIDLFDPNADTAPLIDALLCLEIKPGFIVVDTLARAMAGGDENSTKDMSVFVGNCDRIRAATGAHVMLIHHSGKDAAKGARGSSALRAATDTEIEIAEGRMTVTKQRDIEGGFSASFTLNVVELGRTAKGKPITTCIARLLPPDATAVGSNLPEKQREVLDAMHDLAEQAGSAAIFTIPQLRTAMAAVGIQRKHQAVRSCLRQLAVAGQVRKLKPDGLWALPLSTDQFFAPQPDGMSGLSGAENPKGIFD